MTELNVQELKTFFALSSGISVNNIIPILGYLKVSDGYITKSNLNSFVRHKISVANNVNILLDEKVLKAFLAECKSGTIKVEVDGNNIFLVDGKRKIKFQLQDTNLYPKFPDSEKENEIVLTEDALKAIGRAAKNTGNVGGNEVLDYVHIIDGYVMGTNREKFYTKKFDKLPDVVFDVETCNTISQFSIINYYTQGKYNFFECGNTLYGFIQSEAKTPNIKTFIPKDKPKEYLEIDVAQFTGFCDTVASASPSKVLNCSLNGKHLSFTDAMYEINYDIDLDAEGTYNPELTFLPRVFGGFLKSLGYDTVKIAPTTINKSALSVWNDDDENFIGLIIGTKE